MTNYEMAYEGYLRQAQDGLEQAAATVLNASSTVGKAALYSLTAGGKRVRAVLCMAVCDMLEGNAEAAAMYAAGIEMLHCYSLIHDDLPCMDDDDMRRGQPSCHKAYGEANALLAGDALLTGALETLTLPTVPGGQTVAAVRELTRAAGTHGMILGQELDLYHESVPATHAELENIHRHKTGCLIEAAVMLGAIAAGLPHTSEEPLRRYAQALGLAFQIVDDVLDVTSTPEMLGKPTHSDEDSHKTTFVTLFGTENAMALARELTRDAQQDMKEKFGDKASFLCSLAQTLLERVA